jgi:hypothetical protein
MGAFTVLAAAEIALDDTVLGAVFTLFSVDLLEGPGLVFLSSSFSRFGGSGGSLDGSNGGALISNWRPDVPFVVALDVVRTDMADTDERADMVDAMLSIDALRVPKLGDSDGRLGGNAGAFCCCSLIEDVVDVLEGLGGNAGRALAEDAGVVADKLGDFGAA